MGEGGTLGPSPCYGAVNECEKEKKERNKKDEMVEESKKKNGCRKYLIQLKPDKIGINIPRKSGIDSDTPLSNGV